MEENKEDGKKEEKSESTDTGEGSKPKTTPTIIAANKAAERLEAATAAQKIENDRGEDLAAQKELGGETEAGAESVPKLSEEEKQSQARIKAVGQATGADWAKDEDENKA